MFDESNECVTKSFQALNLRYSHLNNLLCVCHLLFIDFLFVRWPPLQPFLDGHHFFFPFYSLLSLSLSVSISFHFEKKAFYFLTNLLLKKSFYHLMNIIIVSRMSIKSTANFFSAPHSNNKSSDFVGISIVVPFVHTVACTLSLCLLFDLSVPLFSFLFVFGREEARVRPNRFSFWSHAHPLS